MIKWKSKWSSSVCPTLWLHGLQSARLSVHGIFRANLEWVAISFSRGSSRPRDQTRVSRIVGRRFYHLSHKSCTFWREGLYFLFYKFICLSLLGLSCDTQDLVAAFGIFNCSLWTLSCGMWDLAVQPGIEPGPLHWEGRVLASNREVPGLYFHIPPGTLLMIVK